MPTAPLAPSRPPRAAPRARRRARALALAAALALAGARAGWAADLTALSLEQLMSVELPPSGATARFQVSATAVDSCVVSATDLAFGNYDPLVSRPTDATSAVTVTCTGGSGYALGLDAGVGSGATVSTRRLSGAEGTLAYSLYRDAGRSLSWGDASGADAVTGMGSGAPTVHTVYGRIPPGQAVRRGIYTDTITVSVIY